MCRTIYRLVVTGCRALGFIVAIALPLLGQTKRDTQRATVWGFTGPWEAASNASVRAYGSGLDAVVTGWIGLDSTTARPIQPFLFADTVRPRGGTLRRMAIVTSWHGDRFHAKTIRTLAADPLKLGQSAGLIARHAASMRYEGLVLDFETLTASDTSALRTVVRAITDSAHRMGVRPIAVAIPATDSVAYPVRTLLRVADLVMPMLYDQHWAGGTPGPIAAPAWVREALAARIAEAGGPERIVAAFPAYGYRWRTGGSGENVSYADARQIAASSRVRLVRDRASRTLRASAPGSWEMWVTDAELVRALVRDARSVGVRKFAVWRMGQEDPAIWRSVFP